MARAFPGGAATDIITVSRYAAIDNLATLSIGAWVYRSGPGGSSAGGVIWKGNNGTAIYEGSPNRYYFSAGRWSSTVGVWYVPTQTDSVWHYLLWTYSYASTANVPKAYFDGVLAVVNVQAAPVGTATKTDAADAVGIGNRPPGTPCWYGRLAEVAIWNRILTADEARYLFAVAANAPQSGGTLATGLVCYLPITGTSSPEPNPAQPANPGVVTGTSNAAGPSLFVPSGGGANVYLGSTPITLAVGG